MMDATWKNAVRSAVPALSQRLAMLSAMVMVAKATMPR